MQNVISYKVFFVLFRFGNTLSSFTSTSAFVHLFPRVFPLIIISDFETSIFRSLYMYCSNEGFSTPRDLCLPKCSSNGSWLNRSERM